MARAGRGELGEHRPSDSIALTGKIRPISFILQRWGAIRGTIRHAGGMSMKASADATTRRAGRGDVGSEEEIALDEEFADELV